MHLKYYSERFAKIFKSKMHIDDNMSSMNSYYRSFSCGFLFECKGREGECLWTVHNCNRGWLGAALAQPNGVTIRIVHKGGSVV